MLDLMVEKRNENRTVLMVHIFWLQPKVLNRFIILDKGEIVAFGNLDELRNKTGLKDKTLDDIYIHVTQGVVVLDNEALTLFRKLNKLYVRRKTIIINLYLMVTLQFSTYTIRAFIFGYANG